MICRYFNEHITGASIPNIARAIFWSELYFTRCRAAGHAYTTKFMTLMVIIVSAIVIIKLYFGMLELPSFNHHSSNILFE